MSSFLKKFLTNESGATAIEYALIAALISVAAILAMGTTGNKVKGSFNNAASKL